jgi:hypothetical protein
MTITDLEVEAAEAVYAWQQAVTEAVTEAAESHGLDPDLLLDVETVEGYEFVASLDPIENADPADPAFASAIEAAVQQYAAEHPELRVTETVEDTETVQGRVVEAKGTNSDGGRVYRVQILKYGTSRNGNRYTESVMRRDARRYEGAKAYDHHRSQDELRSSTLAGLVGSYRNVEAAADALYGDLHLLPGATHTAEALDRAISNERDGLPPLVGISHDVICDFKRDQNVGGRRVREAVAIKAVQSADIVADPSAGGKAVRAVESTQTTPTGAESTQESEVPVTKTDVLAAFKDASDDELAAVGLSRSGTTESYQPTYTERVVESRVTEAGQPKTSFMARMLIKAKLEDASLPASVTESFTHGLPETVTEADVDAAIANLKSQAAIIERAGLTPIHTAQVTRESRDKKLEGLDKFFAGDFNNGYRSFRSAWMDITGYQGNALGSEDVNRQILRESIGTRAYDSGERTTESATTSTWAELLGDSVTRRVVAEYGLPTLQTWRQIVSDIQPVEDFRTQRVGRIGGFGTLPAVTQGSPYQPLTTPTDEEATYAITKRGGTEDLTMETIANDDRRVISKIPVRLGRAAAQTLYRFVWDMLTSTGVTCTYDLTVLFHTNHANYDASGATLTQTTLGVGRRKMRDQAAYGDTSEILGLQPRFLVVPNELEELAYQLCNSAVAIPSTPASASDSPNINSAQGLTPILVPYYTAATEWILVADPNMTPTIEIGFYQGRQDPEIFTQSDQSVGSMWNADVLTFKIRHIYSGTALDHRGFYKGLT